MNTFNSIDEAVAHYETIGFKTVCRDDQGPSPQVTMIYDEEESVAITQQAPTSVIAETC